MACTEIICQNPVCGHVFFDNSEPRHCECCGSQDLKYYSDEDGLEDEFEAYGLEEEEAL